MFESRGHDRVVQHGEVAFLGFGRGDEADRLQKPAIVEPVHPLERCELDGLEVAPRPTTMNDLGFVEAVDGFGQRVVVRVADAADRRLDPGFGEAFCIFDRNILGAAVAMVDEATAVGRPSGVERLFQSVQDGSRP